MHGTMRSYTAKHRQFLRQRIQELATGIATAMGGSCDVEIIEGIPPCVNDPEMTSLVHSAAVATVGEQNVDNSDAILTTGSDDMSIFLQAVPGCYFIVGAKNAGDVPRQLADGKRRVRSAAESLLCRERQAAHFLSLAALSEPFAVLVSFFSLFLSDEPDLSDLSDLSGLSDLSDDCDSLPSDAGAPEPFLRA